VRSAGPLWPVRQPLVASWFSQACGERPARAKCRQLARRWEKEEGLPVHRHSKEPHACRKDEDSESSSMRLRFGRSLRRAEFPRQTQETSGGPAVSRPRSRRQLPVLSLNRYCNRKDRNYPRRFAASLVQQQPKGREHHGDWLCASGK
jgi:hypothetical protein